MTCRPGLRPLHAKAVSDEDSTDDQIFLQIWTSIEANTLLGFSIAALIAFLDSTGSFEGIDFALPLRV